MLARKASSLRQRETIAPWLHRVAWRLAIDERRRCHCLPQEPLLCPLSPQRRIQPICEWLEPSGDVGGVYSFTVERWGNGLAVRREYGRGRGTALAGLVAPWPSLGDQLGITREEMTRQLTEDRARDAVKLHWRPKDEPVTAPIGAEDPLPVSGTSTRWRARQRNDWVSAVHVAAVLPPDYGERRLSVASAYASVRAVLHQRPHP